MAALLIRGGRIIDPSQKIDRVGDLFISEGHISEMGAQAHPDYDILEAEGMVVCPGFIDLHCHLREPGFEDKETISTGTRAAARGGFTTICCMPNTSPPLDSPSSVEYVKSIATRQGVVRVLLIGCVTEGQRGEKLTDMAGLASAGAVAFSDDGKPVASSQLMRRALENSRKLNLPVIDHCEDLSLSDGGHMNEGDTSRRLGIGGIPDEAEEIIVARDLALARLTGAHVHIAHVSTAGSVELIRCAKEKGVRVSAEATPHHLTLTEEIVSGFNTNAKVNPPLRTRKDIQALIQGLRENIIDIIATDHAPHSRADKACPFEFAAFGISGFETALGSLLRLVHEGQLDLNILIAKLTVEPARILNKNLGTLQVGVPADITIFDLNREWVVEPDLFISKGKNTPLAGSRLHGKVMSTIFQGNMVFKDDLLRIEPRNGSEAWVKDKG